MIENYCNYFNFLFLTKILTLFKIVLKEFLNLSNNLQSIKTDKKFYDQTHVTFLVVCRKICKHPNILMSKNKICLNVRKRNVYVWELWVTWEIFQSAPILFTFHSMVREYHVRCQSKQMSKKMLKKIFCFLTFLIRVSKKKMFQFFMTFLHWWRLHVLFC